jgi:integrase
MPQTTVEKLLLVHDEAENRGVDLSSLLTLLASAKDVPTSTPLATVIAEMIEVKRASGLSERYLVVLEMILNHFAKGREQLPISSVGLADIEKHLASKRPASRSCLRGRISTLMRFAIRRGYYHQANPCERLEPMKLPNKIPHILTLEQVRTALKLFQKHPRPLAWFVLSTFAGLRPEEADATSWDAINFEEKWIRVEAQTTKIRQRRVVYPLPMVFKWLKLAKKLGAELPIYRVTRIWDLKRLRGPLKLAKWPQDCTRHTAASMWLAHCGSAATVATALGHSESVLRKNYMALVTKADAEKFWAL